MALPVTYAYTVEEVVVFCSAICRVEEVAWAREPSAPAPTPSTEPPTATAERDSSFLRSIMMWAFRRMFTTFTGVGAFEYESALPRRQAVDPGIPETFSALKADAKSGLRRRRRGPTRR